MYHNSIKDIFNEIKGTLYYSKIGLIANRYLALYNDMFPAAQNGIVMVNGYELPTNLTSGLEKIIFVG